MHVNRILNDNDFAIVGLVGLFDMHTATSHRVYMHTAFGSFVLYFVAYSIEYTYINGWR